MKLLWKFNLIFVLVFAAGLGVSAYVLRNLLQQQAQDEVIDRARLLMEKAIAVRSYTSTHIRPLLDTQMKYSFLPESVPAFAATEVIAALHKTYPDYSYKEATLNPTNPRDRAVDWEVDVVNQFRNRAELKEYIGQRQPDTGRALYIARPIRITDAACLRCHSTVDAAPRPMIERYGPANGFGWNFNEVVGAQIVSVPMALPLQRADEAFKVYLAAVAGVFVVVGLVLNGMLWLLVVRPITRLAALANQVSLGDMNAPEFAQKGRDEVAELAASFARMRRSMVEALKLLDA
ncbi:putative sensor with HAMP domain [Leptothrix cholodnii SP-6]|uniref:Putative sensor with HAMP domain n=1 Tax=Leptothrix cholodnii (strain ATCC 51168 / LMG 8142 / SP-6) TaxID=395495 RepID=B1XWX0_LEPCP|nr:DUF3365 domain-containing protein [Leptothrix cholodnii]ACB36319.1 putative sensor with HAMP domain [Leptothrix cholodnii SP-6]